MLTMMTIMMMMVTIKNEDNDHDDFEKQGDQGCDDKGKNEYNSKADDEIIKNVQ